MLLRLKGQTFLCHVQNPVSQFQSEVYIYTQQCSFSCKITSEFFLPEWFTGETMMEWPRSSPYLNPIESLRSVAKIIFMKEANNITAKQTNGKQLKLPCRKKKVCYIKMERIQRYRMSLLFVLFHVLFNFSGFSFLFIEVKCDYLVLSNNFRGHIFFNTSNNINNFHKTYW